ncbi:hypothetical protein HYFRA_00013747 [Hymenoscyphus fraxineus]|uniref:2EXR domain-containing protein n=1 Tax=Hymenoscyphus fraxineus TaxID=746836 RepID=A0A9N9LCZ2_9HELO|nr:hypothetical protein HYFRA_00013747 [Hymenoscyphus fraxineus]
MIESLGAHRPDTFMQSRGCPKDTLIACIIWKKSDVYPICILQQPGFVPDPGEVICFPRPSWLPRPGPSLRPDGQYTTIAYHRMDDNQIASDIYNRLAGMHRLKGGLDARWNNDKVQLAAVSSDDGLLFRLAKVSHKDALIAVAQYLDYSYVPSSTSCMNERSNPLNNETHRWFWNDNEFKQLLRKMQIDPDRTNRFEQYRLLLVSNLMKIITTYESQNGKVMNLFPKNVPQIQLARGDHSEDEDTAMGGTTTTGRDLKEFHMFPLLPAELQREIFEMAMDDIGPRAVQPYVVRGIVKVTRRAPALFHVNHEARDVCMNSTLSKYQKVRAIQDYRGHRPSHLNVGFWFNPEKDILYLGRRSLALCTVSHATHTIHHQMPDFMAAVKSVAFYVQDYRGPIFKQVSMFSNAVNFIAVYDDEWLSFEPHHTTLHVYMTITVDFSEHDAQGNRGVLKRIETFDDGSHSWPPDWQLFNARVHNVKESWIAGEAARVADWNNDHQDPADHITARTGVLKFSLAAAMRCEKEYFLPKTSKFHPLYDPRAPQAYAFEEEEALSRIYRNDDHHGGMTDAQQWLNERQKISQERKEIARQTEELNAKIEALKKQRQAMVVIRAKHDIAHARMERGRAQMEELRDIIVEQIGKLNGAKEALAEEFNTQMNNPVFLDKFTANYAKFLEGNGEGEHTEQLIKELPMMKELDGTKVIVEKMAEFAAENAARTAAETAAENDIENVDAEIFDVDNTENDDVEMSG